jgi:hypothetical protein
MKLMEFEDFSALHLILKNAHWAGGPSQEERQEAYFRERMWDAVRRLWRSAELLGEVLIEILEEMEQEAALLVRGE